MTVDKNNYLYWESLLDSEWLWDIDKSEWFDIIDMNNNISEKGENIVSSIKKKYNNILDISYLEKKYNITIIVDEDNKKIVFLDNKDKSIIWEVYDWKMEVLWTDYDHVWIEVYDMYKWKWFWTILMNLYKNKFSLPQEDLTQKYEKYKFLKKFWYEPYELINLDTQETLHIFDDTDIKNMLDSWNYILKMTIK